MNSKQDQISLLVLGGVESTTLSDEEKDFFAAEKPLGITLFKRNFSLSAVHLQSPIHEIRSLYKTKRQAIFAIDQEGGRVSRLKGSVPDKGPALNLVDHLSSKSEQISFLFQYGYEIAQVLHSLNIQINFAPVTDIFTQPKNDAIGDRCFDCEADSVSYKAMAFLNGLKEGGVVGCFKHFPGQGNALQDTHLELASINLTFNNLWSKELVPYKDHVRDVPLVMLSHCLYPMVDNVPPLLSSRWLSEILRQSLGFNGLIVSDDLTMGAVKRLGYSFEEVCVKSVLAGTNLLLVCSDLHLWKRALFALREENKSSKIFQKKVQASIQRIQKIFTIS